MRMTLAIVTIAFVAACSTTPSTPDEAPVSPAQQSSQPQAVEAVDKPASDVDPAVQSVEDATHRVSPDERTTIAWLAEGANAYLGKISLAPETEVPLHTHESEEYLYILEGGGVMTIDGKEYDLGPGMAVAVPAGVEHGFVNGSEPTVAVQFFADSEGAQRFLQWSKVDTVEPQEEAADAEDAEVAD